MNKIKLYSSLLNNCANDHKMAFDVLFYKADQKLRVLLEPNNFENKKIESVVSHLFDDISYFYDLYNNKLSESDKQSVKQQKDELSGRISATVDNFSVKYLFWHIVVKVSSYFSPNTYWGVLQKKSDPLALKNYKEIKEHIKLYKQSFSEFTILFNEIKGALFNTSGKKGFLKTDVVDNATKKMIEMESELSGIKSLYEEKMKNKGIIAEVIGKEIDFWNLDIQRFNSYLFSLTQPNVSQTSFVSKSSYTSLGTYSSLRFGLPNFGLTCYVNTFFKTFLFKIGTYIEVIKRTELVRAAGESRKNFSKRKDLRNSLIRLHDLINTEPYNRDEVRAELYEIINNPSLKAVIPRTVFGYTIGDARELARIVFILMGVNQDPSISIQLGRVVEEIGGKNRSSVSMSSGPMNAIQIFHGSTIQERINSYFKIIDFSETERWKPDGVNPVPSRSRECIICSNPQNLPERLTFNINPTVGNKIIAVEDKIDLPISDDNGNLIGHMEMVLEEVSGNRRENHYLAFVKESDGTWTEHNDSITTFGLSKAQISSTRRNGMNILDHGCQFNYRKVGFRPLEQS